MAWPKGKPRPINSGRKKGTLNRKTIKAEELAAKLNCDPLEILLKFAMGDWQGLGYDTDVIICQTSDGKAQYEKVLIPPELRQKAAQAACDYLYPKKKAIEHSLAESEELSSIKFEIVRGKKD